MKSKLAKPVFFMFLLITFLAGWYFYVMNPNPNYFEYMVNMPPQQYQQFEPKYQDPSTKPKMHQQQQPPYIIQTPNSNSKENQEPVNVKDASRENTDFNTNMYAGFDPTGQYIGVYTNLDKIHQSTSFSELSDNPMDANWGGVLYTKDAVDSGKYADNVVMPYGIDPKRGVGISTSVHAGIGDVKSVFA
uniref:Uncharacterized protein n=1 Tax=viral metagenome TaxID=1070528 RepID=A0A6C0HZC9_9ZZZZ